MHPRLHLKLCLLPLLGLLPLHASAQEEPQPTIALEEPLAKIELEDRELTPDQQPDFAYQKMSLQLFNDAVKSLEEYHETHPATRETRYALAAGLINFQPVTNQRIQDASNELGSLAKENPADDIGVQAKYLQARIEQIHRDTPNIPEALRHYQELLDSQPQHPVAQRALARIILLNLFTFKKEEFQSPAREQLAASLGERAKTLTDPLAIRMAEMVLAQAYFQFDWDKQNAMEHTERALATGMVRERSEGNHLMMVALTAEELGQNEKALQYFREFVKKNERDVRTHTVRQKIAALEGSAPPAEPSAEVQPLQPVMPPEGSAPAPEPEPSLQP